jgi:hypothetical protein
MGTEILGIFILIPPILFLWNLWQLRKKESRRKALFLIGSGVLFLCYFCISAGLDGYLMQGVVYGSLFFAPFYLVAWILVSSIPWFRVEHHAK